MFDKLKQKYINKGYENGYAEGKNFGYEACKILEYKKGYNAGLAWAVEYYEGIKHDQYIKQEVDKVKPIQTDMEIFRDLDGFLTWCKYVVEISDSDYFRSYVFENNTVEDLEYLINYIDYLSTSDLIISTYPETFMYLPELLMSLCEVKESKEMLKEAEKVLK